MDRPGWTRRAGTVEPRSRARCWRGHGTRISAGVALAIIAAWVAASANAATPSARAARTISITELGRLHLTSHHGFTLNEEGKALGTIPGTIYIHLHVTSTNHVSAEVNIYPHGGSVTGYASAGYHPSGGTATFSGTMNVTRGTGGWNGAHGNGLTFTGTEGGEVIIFGPASSSGAGKEGPPGPEGPPGREGPAGPTGGMGPSGPQSSAVKSLK